MVHMDRHSLISENQHGFRKRRYCETQLVITVQDLASSLNSRSQQDMIIMDFSKVFDRVAHERLLSKLHFLGIRGKLLDWISHFLTRRHHQVVLEG